MKMKPVEQIPVWQRERDTIDRETPQQGEEKTSRIDLGLALLSLARKEGQAFSWYDIAAWCGCTNAAIYQMERRALRKVATALQFGGFRGVCRELGVQPIDGQRLRKKRHRNDLRNEVRAKEAA